MIRTCLLIVAAFAILPAPALATLSERDLASAVARPPAGARLPPLPFTDLTGHTGKLTVLAQGKPLVLIFADYTCRNVCSPGLTLTAARLRDTGLRPGADYQLAVIGIDPKDTRDDALHFAQAIANTPDVARTTRFLRGDTATVAAATRALGYGYVYDPDVDQYAHDASIYVFARDGTLTTVLPEIGLMAAPLKAALAEQRTASAGGWIAHAAHMCYGFAAAQGRFGRPIVLGLQVLGILLLCIAGLAFWRSRKVEL